MWDEFFYRNKKRIHERIGQEFIARGMEVDFNLVFDLQSRMRGVFNKLLREADNRAEAEQWAIFEKVMDGFMVHFYGVRKQAVEVLQPVMLWSGEGQRSPSSR